MLKINTLAIAAALSAMLLAAPASAGGDLASSQGAGFNALSQGGFYRMYRSLQLFPRATSVRGVRNMPSCCYNSRGTFVGYSGGSPIDNTGVGPR